MEGFGVLRAATLADVPAVEIRAISNEIGEPDRSRWQVNEAIEELSRVTPLLLARIEAALALKLRARGSGTATSSSSFALPL